MYGIQDMRENFLLNYASHMRSYSHAIETGAFPIDEGQRIRLNIFLWN